MQVKLYGKGLTKDKELVDVRDEGVWHERMSRL